MEVNHHHRRHHRPVPRLRSTGTGAYVVTSSRLTPPYRRCVSSINWSNVLPVTMLRHTEMTSRAVAFGSMNVASLSPSRLDELLVVVRQ